jgi:phospholipase/carboxylesterase
MNRLTQFAEKSLIGQPFGGQVGTQPTSTLARRTTQRLWSRDETPFATFAPLNYEPGYAYPLIVWLHDRGGNEHHLRRVMPHVSMRNFVAVAPRGTVRRRSGGFRWRQDVENIEAAETRIFDSIAEASGRFNVHAKRVFLAGCGCGGTMAVRIAWRNPERFAGVVTMGGPLPTNGSPLRRVNELRRVPCMVAMSRSSLHYPEDQVCRDLRLMHSAGCSVALRQYPGNEDLTTSMLSDLNVWAMELVCGRNG